MNRFLFLPFAVTILIGLQHTALAGPPLVCHPLAIGNAASLPSGDGPFGSDPDYAPRNLAKETIAYLDADVPVIVRMETIRRAVLYVTNTLKGARHGNTYDGATKRRIAALADGFKQRLSGMENTTPEYAHSLFDYGYLNACLKQAWANPDDDGYETVLRANTLLGGNAEMQFALAMISKHPARSALEQHLAEAKRGAMGDPLLAQNLEKQFRDK